MTARIVRLLCAGALVCSMTTTVRAQQPDPHAGHAPASRPAEAERRAPKEEERTVPLPSFVPPVTDEMRAAAFPDVHGHAAHDRRLNSFVFFDQLEWRSGSGPGNWAWSNSGWIGGDRDRVWFRTEGDGRDGGVDGARAHVLYGRAIARWWDVVAGVRQDFQPGAETWLAVGIQGLAPGFFEVEATGYLGGDAQTAAHLEVSYDLLLTNRLVLQPTLALNLYRKANPSLGVGSGLNSVDGGLRLRYHVTREIAPYLGVTWLHALGDAADARDDAAVPNGAARVVTGLRVWF